MAVRYVEIGQHPDIRRELRGTLAEVLTAPSPNPGTFAMPEDVAGCFLEMGLDGKWTGASVGTMPKATADALYASGALANLATGATYRDTSGTSYSYQGAEVGWGHADGMIYCAVDPFSVVSAASTAAVDFAIATIKGGSIADGDILEVFFPSETAAGNVGNDQFAFFIGTAVVDNTSSASSSLTQVRCGVTKNGTTTRKIIATAFSALRTNTFSTTAIDWSVDQVIKVRITPATIGNSSYVRHISVKVTKC